jgi:O-acetyl-ADP-ribose deacetylase
VTSTPSARPAQPLSLRFGRTTVTVCAGDVFSVPADVIVIPANRRGIMVAGVAGHVRLRGGVDIERDLMRQAPLTLGTSVATTSGELSGAGTQMILHAIVFDDLGGGTRIDIVERAIESVLESADRHRARAIAIPPLGTGIGQGRLSQDAVYATLVEAIAAHLRRFSSRIDHIWLVCPDARDTRAVFALVQDAHTLWWQMKTSSRST